jgi:hypothetical protein
VKARPGEDYIQNARLEEEAGKGVDNEEKTACYEE